MHHDKEHTFCFPHHPRMFLTKEEKIEHLQKYKNWLDSESKGVEETITKLQES